MDFEFHRRQGGKTLKQGGRRRAKVRRGMAIILVVFPVIGSQDGNSHGGSFRAAAQLNRTQETSAMALFIPEERNPIDVSNRFSVEWARRYESAL
jgi:hypothetical protein